MDKQALKLGTTSIVHVWGAFLLETQHNKLTTLKLKEVMRKVHSTNFFNYFFFLLCSVFICSSKIFVNVNFDLCLCRKLKVWREITKTNHMRHPGQIEHKMLRAQISVLY